VGQQARENIGSGHASLKDLCQAATTSALATAGPRLLAKKQVKRAAESIQRQAASSQQQQLKTRTGAEI